MTMTLERRDLESLPPIGLDDQASTKMHEINHIRADRLLPPEFLAIGSMCPQMLPQRVLAFCHVLSQVPGKLLLLHHPSPQPLSRKGRGA